MATSPTIHQAMKAPTRTAIELPKQYQEHVDAFYWQRDTDGDLPTHFDGISSARFVKGGAVKVEFVDGEILYFYKGYEFHESSESPKGYYGRWRLNGGHWTDSLAGIVAIIEGKIAEKVERRAKAEKFDRAAFDHIMGSGQDPVDLARTYGLTKPIVNQIQMGKLDFNAARTAALAV